MKKSLSLLLAIALVFGMFSAAASAATPSTPAEAGQYLKDLKVLVGDKDGDLMEDAAWSRQNIVVLLARLLDKEAEAAATAKSHTFKDVPKGYYDGFISWAKEEGIINGYSATKFGFNDELTVKDFSAIVLRALGTNNDATIAEDAVKAGIFPEGTDFSAVAKRGDTFVALVAGLNAEVAGTGKTLGAILGLPGFDVTAGIASAAATAAKKITVTFNGAVDTAKAKITVWNGANQVNSKSVTFSDDKKSAVVEFSLNLPAADYTVKVEGLTETALTAAVKVEAEKVAKIEFASDKAALNRADNTIVSIGYKVLNQYGETINSTALSATAGKGTATAASGVLTLDAPTAFVLGEKVVVSLVHTSGAFATATVEVGSVAQVSTVDIVKLYQQDNKELVAGSGDPFFLVLDLKDQYGNSVTDLTYLNGATAAERDLIVTVSNPAAASLNGYNAGDSKATFGNALPVDGSNKVNIQLAGPFAAGTSTVTIISKSTGAKDSFDIVVKESVKVDTLTLTAPASAPANSTVNIPFTAVDQFGAAIAHPTNGQVTSRSLSSGGAVTFEKDIVKNVTNLKVTLGAKGTTILTIITGTNKVAQLTINVTDESTPTLITGTKNLETSLHKDGGVAALGTGNVVVKDQYGNDATVTYGNDANEYRVKIDSSATDKVAVNNGGIAGAGTQLSAVAKGSSSITLTLQKNAGTLGTPDWKDVANSSYTFTEKVVDKADIKSYTATVAGTVYVNATADFFKSLTVKGTLEDGSTVTIPNDVANYEVNVLTTNLVHTTDGKINGSGFTGIATDKTEADATILVIVKGASAPETHPVTVKLSNAARVATTLSLKDAGTAGGAKEADGVVSVDEADVENTAEIVAFVRGIVKVEDQYGVELANTASVVVTNISNGHTETTLVAEDTFSVTAVTANGKYFSFKVIVK